VMLDHFTFFGPFSPLVPAAVAWLMSIGVL
jgi:hypothetical protein